MFLYHQVEDDLHYLRWDPFWYSIMCTHTSMYTQEQDALLPVHRTLHQLISLYLSTPATILICTQTTAEPSVWLWNKEALQY